MPFSETPVLADAPTGSMQECVLCVLASTCWLLHILIGGRSHHIVVLVCFWVSLMIGDVEGLFCLVLCFDS